MSLYTELVNLLPEHCIDSHESDLYVKDCPEVKTILKKYPMQSRNARPFRSNIDGTIWIDIPFAYEPWWEERCPTKIDLKDALQ
jgi:hypothetical protein